MASKQRKYWYQSALFAVFERLSVQVFGMGTVMILLRAFAAKPETYGVWALFLTIGSFIEVGRNGLIQSAKIKYLSGAGPEEYRRINTASFALNLILTAGIGCFLLLCSPWLSQLLKAPGLDRLLRIYLLTNLALVPFVQFNYLQQANLQFRGIFLTNFIRQGLFFGFVLFTSLSGRSFQLENLAWAQCAVAAIASILSWFFARPYIRYSAAVDSRWMGHLLRFGVYTFGTNLSTMLFKTIDRFMLGILLPTQALAMQAVAVFDPALRVSNIMEIPIQAMATVSYPQSTRRMAEEGKQSVRHLYEKSVGTVLALLLPLCIAVLLFPDLLIRIVAGDSEAFRGAAAVLQVTILYTLFVPYSRQFGIVMDTLGKPNLNFYFVLGSALSNIVSNYFFILQFGMIGAAYGTLLTLFLRFIVQQIILQRLLGIRPFQPLLYAAQFSGKVLRLALRVVKNSASLSEIRKQL